MVNYLVRIGNTLINAYQEVTEWLSYELTLGEFTISLFEVFFGAMIGIYIGIAIIKWSTPL